jgi:hypothetical protein
MGREWSDPIGAILFDMCEQCDIHANGRGLTLDRNNVVRMWGRMLDVELHSGEYLTEAERTLGGYFDGIRVLLERHPYLSHKGTSTSCPPTGPFTLGLG